jgi:hypothetical protein
VIDEGRLKGQKAHVDLVYKVPAWFGFIKWALGEKWIRAEFEKDTGIKAPPPARSGLEAMIDEATGIRLDYVKKFVVWLTRNYWGEGEAPAIYFEKFKEGEDG